MNKQALRDAAERTAWTFAQAGVATVSVEAFDLPLWAIAPVAMALAALKGYLATKVGSPNTAATLPREDDTPLAVGDGEV